MGKKKAKHSRSGDTLSASARRFAEKVLPQSEVADFLDALQGSSLDETCLLWLDEETESPFATHSSENYPWMPSFVQQVARVDAPGRHPLHETGAYYCMDTSSVFAAAVMRQVPSSPALILDMCASPGGKSLYAFRCLSPQLLVANEVVRKRTKPLCVNFDRCDVQPAAVIWSDTSFIREHAAGAADLVLVDAPCSGQSLLVKGTKSPGCFHSPTIKMNARRQKGIMSHAMATVRPGGFLAYMTCTYSVEENEKVIDWILKKFPDFSVVSVPELASHQSSYVDYPAYRMWPHHGIGSGSFTCLLQRAGDADVSRQSIALEPLRVQWSRGIGE